MNDLTILHLSDLHIDSSSNSYSKLHGALLADIKSQIAAVSDDSLVIVVTGDILDKGDHNAIPSAKKFFQKLKEITTGKVKAIYLTAGNHDKYRTSGNKILVPAYRALFDSYGQNYFNEDFSQSLWEMQIETYAQSGYLELLRYIYEDLFSFPDIGEIAKKTYGVHILDVHGQKYCFILLNTAWSCIDEHDARKLILGKFQLNEIGLSIRDCCDADSTVMTIAMGHHPIEDLYGTEQDALFSNMISYNGMCANVYLCGHEHDRKAVNWSNNRHKITTLMTGFGWPETLSDHVHEHFYSIYTFNLDLNSMDIYVRRTKDNGGFMPDLSIYTGCKTNQHSKLERPIHFEESQGAIQLNTANNLQSKSMFASTEFLDICVSFQDKLHNISLNISDIINGYKNDLYENVSYENLSHDEKDEELDSILLDYLANPYFFMNSFQEKIDLLRRILRQNTHIIFENFLSYIQNLCQIFLQELVEDVGDGEIVRFHFRYLSDKNTMMYTTLCSSFTACDNTDVSSNQPSDIKYGDLLEATFLSQSGTLIYSINKCECKNKLNEKWADYITVIPKFEENIYSKKVNRSVVKKFPLITFGVTISHDSHRYLLQCMDFLGIDRFISKLIQCYTTLFMLDIGEFVFWLKKQNKKEE